VDALRILLVDDDIDAARTLAPVLERHLGPTTTVPDVYQALACVADESFDAIVLEVALPGASGIDLLERLPPGPAAVVVTWLVSPAVKARAMEAGAHSVLAKPCRPEHLVTEIRKIIRRRTAEPLVLA
jgi:DNA-binding response OmpR family regulator